MLQQIEGAVRGRQAQHTLCCVVVPLVGFKLGYSKETCVWQQVEGALVVKYQVVSFLLAFYLDTHDVLVLSLVFYLYLSELSLHVT